MYDLQEIRKENFSYLASPFLFKERSIFIAFTNRQGGVSSEPYNTLNLSFNVGDKKDSVKRNRLITAKKVGINLDRLTTGKQIHSNKVVLVDENCAGRGAYNYLSAVDSTDCLVTSTKSLSIAILTADCLPVILVDKKIKKVAVIHCGWRGLAKDIIQKTLKYFNLSETLAFLGPAIGECCYEVSKEVAIAFNEQINKKGKCKISLEKIAAKQLIRSGVNRTNIYKSGLCTACNTEKFFSYRTSNGITGRQAAIAVIK